MAIIALFLADGCEEIEALTQADILRRARMDVDILSIMDTENVITSHNIHVKADGMIGDADFSKYDGIILPGGLKGTENLKKHPIVRKEVQEFFDAGKLVAAICAGPTVLGDVGILKGKRATCYPGCEEGLIGAEVIKSAPAVRDGNIITARGMGASISFGLQILEYFEGEEAAKKMAEKIIYRIY